MKPSQKTPPTYDLANIHVPTALYYGGHDDLADLTDVQVSEGYDSLWFALYKSDCFPPPPLLCFQTLINDLPTATVVHTKLIESFAHLDFTWGEDAHTLVYADLMQEIAKYNNMSQ